MRITRTLALLATGAMAASVLTAGGSSAAPPGTTITVGDPTVIANGNCAGGRTYLQPTAPYRTTAGILTSYRIRLAPGHPAGTQVAFKVARLDTGGHRVFATTPLVTGMPGSVVTGPLWVPVRTGDVIGAYFSQTGNCVEFTDDGGDIILEADGNTGVGEPVVSAFAEYRLAVVAEVESDTDRDGFGDVTQDVCATDPTTQRPCAASAPQTRIPLVSVKKRGKVRVALSATEPATFRCQVDRRAYRVCTNPFRTRLKPGRHTIRAYAVDRFGNRDATPAVKKVKVKKVKKKRKRR